MISHTLSQNRTTISPTRRKRRIMIFDVETTGLIPKMDPMTKQRPLLEEMPHIIQLSFIVFNMYEYIIEKKFNAYIKLDNLDCIKEEITQLTGITKEKCENGMDIREALQEFYEEFQLSDIIIAHNLAFDKQMILIELERHYLDLSYYNPSILNLFDSSFCEKKGIELYCTMMSSINLCNIQAESNTINPDGTKKTYKKFPKLSELYYTLFKSKAENLHNAVVDTLVCLRCFLKIRMHKEIHNTKYNNMLKSVTKII